MIEDNMVLLSTICAGGIIAVSDIGAGGIIIFIGITNRYLADIHKEMKND